MSSKCWNESSEIEAKSKAKVTRLSDFHPSNSLFNSNEKKKQAIIVIVWYHSTDWSHWNIKLRQRIIRCIFSVSWNIISHSELRTNGTLSEFMYASFIIKFVSILSFFFIHTNCYTCTENNLLVRYSSLLIILFVSQSH